MTRWDLLLTDAHLATMEIGGGAYGAVHDAALAVTDGRIAWLGSMRDLPEADAAQRKSLDGRWVTPALIDCHTHLVFGGDRAQEFEQRLSGATYADIAKAGGGIASTVRATRAADAESLAASAGARLDALSREGVATVEIKSGYGLNLDAELKMLRVARDLGAQRPITVHTTFLGAHTVPAEYERRADDYMSYVAEEVLPEAHALGLVDAVDAYCERIAFTAAQIERLFDRAVELELPVKLHADQLSDGGGAELAARYRALSADHLEYTSQPGVDALSSSGTVAVLLPGAYLNLQETQLPPVAALREAGVPIAVASDCNPGSSPVCSLRAAMHLGANLFRLTPEECLAGTTRNAALALGLNADRGSLEVGKRADLAVWDIGHPAELTYWLGGNPLHQLIVNGVAELTNE